jgi:predicted metal-binding membrane protein
MGRPASSAAVRRWWVQRSALVAGGLLIAAAAAAWVATIRQADSMSMPGMSMSSGSSMDGSMSGMTTSNWNVHDGLAFVGSWGVMMAAMMLPSAVPMIALYGTVARSRARVAPTAVFALPYAVAWLAFGVPVYAVAAALVEAARDHPRLHDAAPYAVATVLAAAGAYQFSTAKRACLRSCQNPLSFLATRWRPGLAGAVRVGLAHAGYCLGCCWLLMVVLVAAGAMGLAWVLLVAAVVFVEKIGPSDLRVAWLTGAVLLVLGIAVAIHPAIASGLRG